MGDFNPVPGLTNTKGLIGTLPNQIEPGKRMLSSMCPTIVARDGKPFLIIGSPGGRTIINSVFQTIVHVLDFEMSIDKAIEAGKHVVTANKALISQGGWEIFEAAARKNVEGSGTAPSRT